MRLTVDGSILKYNYSRFEETVDRMKINEVEMKFCCTILSNKYTKYHKIEKALIRSLKGANKI